jgi:hypothetical protein
MTPKPAKLEELAAQLRNLSETLASEDPSQLRSASARKVRETIGNAYETIRKVMDDLDPIKHPGFVFDPSNPGIAGRIVGITLIAQPRKPLANVDRFYGSGVYAIYYKGKFAAYKPISGKEHPIYVGKADPAEASAKTANEQGDRLSRRLIEHSKNVARAHSTLSLDDFDYRALVVQTGWQESAEGYLIRLFKPIWNSEIDICYGFGKHGDSFETRANSRSPWDTLHPGRTWAHGDTKMKDARAPKRIVEDIAEHLANNPPLSTVEEILKRFLAEMRGAS